jgi:hypothetical protein
MKIKMIMPNDIDKYCACKKAEKTALYNKLKTSGNDPNISTKMKYASYVNTSRTNYVPFNSLDKWFK